MFFSQVLHFQNNPQDQDMSDKIRALDKREFLIIIEGYFFLFLIESICCDPSSEPSHRDGSDEGSQHIFLCRINKTYP